MKKQKERAWNIAVVVCLALLIGAGVLEVLFFSEKPAKVTVESVSPFAAASDDVSAGDTPDVRLAVPSVSGEQTGVPERQTENAAETALPDRNLNTADAAALRRVSGVGDVLAERIISYRAQIGGFTRRAQLLDIEGIGETIAGRILEEFYIPDELPPETTVLQTTAENRTESSRSETARTQAVKTTAETVTETEPVLPPKRDINSVTQEELLEIPGMNEARAASIIKVREQIGRYSDLHELTYCEGLSGDYIVNTLFLYLYIEGADGSAEP